MFKEMQSGIKTNMKNYISDVAYENEKRWISLIIYVIIQFLFLRFGDFSLLLKKLSFMKYYEEKLHV